MDCQARDPLWNRGRAAMRQWRARFLALARQAGAGLRSRRVDHAVAVPACAAGAVERGGEVVALELGVQVDCLGNPGATGQLEGAAAGI